MSYDDGLDEFEDSALVRALRAPGAPGELAGERTAVAAYRRVHRGGSVRGLVTRLGVGGTALLAAVTLSGGVAAAAYTRVLPDPVQDAAHRALGGIGVPAKAPGAPEPPSKPEERPEAAPAGDAPTTGPTATPSSGFDERSTRSGRAGSGPSDDPTPTRGTSDEPTATAHPAAPATPSAAPSSAASTAAPPAPGTAAPTEPATAAGPAVVSATTSLRRVVVGSQVLVSGVVHDAAGRPVSGQRVWLRGRNVGTAWARVASAVTGADGSVAIRTAPIQQTTFVRLTARGPARSEGETRAPVVRSAATRIAARPLVRASADGSTVHVSVTGARAGDAVEVLRRRDGRLERLGIRQLDARGHTSYQLTGLSGRVRVVVRVLRTRTHTAARASLTVRMPAPEPTRTPSPEPEPTQEPEVSDGDAARAGTEGRSTTSGS